MWMRMAAVVLAVLALPACSSGPPVAGAVGETEVSTGAMAAPEPDAPAASMPMRCKTVLGEVEGFGQESVRATAEKSRQKAIAEETAHRRVIGQSVARVDLEDTECVAVYPIGAEEWHCMARAKVCATPASG
ncbi:MAG: hypothetical protein R3D57_09325 [Hyphomicrobiaceae bacterium]